MQNKGTNSVETTNSRVRNVVLGKLLRKTYLSIGSHHVRYESRKHDLSEPPMRLSVYTKNTKTRRPCSCRICTNFYRNQTLLRILRPSVRLLEYPWAFYLSRNSKSLGRSKLSAQTETFSRPFVSLPRKTESRSSAFSLWKTNERSRNDKTLYCFVHVERPTFATCSYFFLTDI